MTSSEYRTFLDIPEQVKQIENALQEAEINHDNMAEVGLCEELCELKHKYLTLCVSSLSSGTVAGIIGSDKYIQIDKAINKTLVYLNRLYDDSEPDLIYIGLDVESIANLVKECYHDNEL